MRNRAKCKLCSDILESFHRYDYVSCRCGEISIDGGQDLFRCASKDWNNFLRVDDNGNEITIKVIEKNDKDNRFNAEGTCVNPTNDTSVSSQYNSDIPKLDDNQDSPLTKQELLKELDMMIKNIEDLPDVAMRTYVNHYDLYSFMLLVSSIFKAKW